MVWLVCSNKVRKPWLCKEFHHKFVNVVIGSFRGALRFSWAAYHPAYSSFFPVSLLFLEKLKLWFAHPSLHCHSFICENCSYYWKKSWICSKKHIHVTTSIHKLYCRQRSLGFAVCSTMMAISQSLILSMSSVQLDTCFRQISLTIACRLHKKCSIIFPVLDQVDHCVVHLVRLFRAKNLGFNFHAP